MLNGSNLLCGVWLDGLCGPGGFSRKQAMFLLRKSLFVMEPSEERVYDKYFANLQGPRLLNVCVAFVLFVFALIILQTLTLCLSVAISNDLLHYNHDH